jgi:hypothetical protein
MRDNGGGLLRREELARRAVVHRCALRKPAAVDAVVYGKVDQYGTDGAHCKVQVVARPVIK